jgi:hypothetical protein
VAGTTAVPAATTTGTGPSVSQKQNNTFNGRLTFCGESCSINRCCDCGGSRSSQ